MMDKCLINDDGDYQFGLENYVEDSPLYAKVEDSDQKPRKYKKREEF